MSTSAPRTDGDKAREFVISDSQRRAVFWEWCLRREVTTLAPHVLLVAPLLLAELSLWMFWPSGWHPQQGRNLLQFLFGLSATMIVGMGGVYAAQAVCWEVSPELRELVRLTGIGPRILLYCRLLSRWWTILAAMLLLVPIACLAVTFGGTSPAHFWAFGCCLLMLATLTAGFTAVAGISATESQNSATTAAMGVFLLMLLYHMIYWIAALLIMGICWQVTGDWQQMPGPWRILFDSCWRSAPLTVLTTAAMAPELFSPLKLSYWIHFVTALLAFYMATGVMQYKFRAVRAPALENDGSSAGTAPNRPRVFQRAFFWKDFYILGGGQRTMVMWSIAYIILATVILVTGLQDWNGGMPLAMGFMAELAAPIIFAVRFDSLLAAEFRQKTWQTLMTLPIDRRELLWGKLWAVAWEHRFALVPIVTALAFALPKSPVAILMAGALAPLAGIVMCQVSAIYYVTPRAWWTGLVQALLLMFLVVFSIGMWATLPPIVSFLMTAVMLVITIVPVQAHITEELKTWSEPES